MNEVNRRNAEVSDYYAGMGSEIPIKMPSAKLPAAFGSHGESCLYSEREFCPAYRFHDTVYNPVISSKMTHLQLVPRGYGRDKIWFQKDRHVFTMYNE